MANEFIARNGLIALDNSIVTGSLRVSGSITTIDSVINDLTSSWAGRAITASWTTNVNTASWANNATNAINAQTASSADNFTVRNTLTATTIVVQVITSSQDFVTGSSRFGTVITNTHQFTGSVSITGSLTVIDGITNNLTASWAARAISASLADNAVTASRALNANTASHAILAVTASRALNANTASYVQNAASASYALSASYAPGGASLTGGSGSFVAVWATPTTLTTGSIFDTPSGVGINTRFPAAELQVSGTTDVFNVRGSGSLATSSIFTVDGAAGRLFSVNDSLSGSLFSVNTIAGLPVMEAFSDNTVRIGQYGRRALFVSQSFVGVGKETSLSATLDVSGSFDVTGSSDFSGSITINSGSIRIASGSVFTPKVLGNSATPTIVAGTGAGTTPTISISGSDTAGYIRVLTGTTPSGGNNTIVAVTFASAYPGLPYVLTSPANFSASFVSAGNVSGTFTTASTTGFSIFAGQVSLRGGQAYTWSYHVIGN